MPITISLFYDGWATGALLLWGKYKTVHTLSTSPILLNCVLTLFYDYGLSVRFTVIRFFFIRSRYSKTLMAKGNRCN